MYVEYRFVANMDYFYGYTPGAPGLTFEVLEPSSWFLNTYSNG